MKTPALSVSLRQDGGLHEGAGRKGTPSSMQRNASGSAAVPLWDTGKGNGRNGKASAPFLVGGEGVGRSGVSCRYDVVGEREGHCSSPGRRITRGYTRRNAKALAKRLRGHDGASRAAAKSTAGPLGRTSCALMRFCWWLRKVQGYLIHSCIAATAATTPVTAATTEAMRM
jgi:hypothetical protein